MWKQLTQTLRDAVRRAIATLQLAFHEIVILRELDGFIKKEMAELAEAAEIQHGISRYVSLKPTVRRRFSSQP
jgi:hypothetical protein